MTNTETNIFYDTEFDYLQDYSYSSIISSETSCGSCSSFIIGLFFSWTAAMVNPYGQQIYDMFAQTYTLALASHDGSMRSWITLLTMFVVAIIILYCENHCIVSFAKEIAFFPYKPLQIIYGSILGSGIIYGAYQWQQSYDTGSHACAAVILFLFGCTSWKYIHMLRISHANRKNSCKDILSEQELDIAVESIDLKHSYPCGFGKQDQPAADHWNTADFKKRYRFTVKDLFTMCKRIVQDRSHYVGEDSEGWNFSCEFAQLPREYQNMMNKVNRESDKQVHTIYCKIYHLHDANGIYQYAISDHPIKKASKWF